MRAPVALVTGGNSGIGRATAAALLGRGWEVAITARRPAAGAAAVERLRGAGPGPVTCLSLDLADLASVRACAEAAREQWGSLEALVNNAGTVRSRRALSVDGYELTFQVNHLGHFLLTTLLLDRLRADGASPSPGTAGGGRVVTVSSQMHARARGLDFEDLHMAQGYGAARAYAHSKLANVLFSRELARRLAGTGVTANAVHPGGVRTELGGGGELTGLAGRGWWLMKRFLRSPGAGARPVVRLVAEGDVAGVSGAYFDRMRQVEPAAAARDDVAARRLWAVSAALVGVEG